MSTIAWAVVVGVLASPNPAIADDNCAAITGTSETQMTGNPDWPTSEPFGWFTGTASVQIDGGQALILSVCGEVTDVVIPAESDSIAAPTAWVSETIELAGVGGFAAHGEVVVTLPEVTDMDMLFQVGAALTISDGTGDFMGVSGSPKRGRQIGYGEIAQDQSLEHRFVDDAPDPFLVGADRCQLGVFDCGGDDLSIHFVKID